MPRARFDRLLAAGVRRRPPPGRAAANPGMAAMHGLCPTAALGLIPPPLRLARAALRAVILIPRAKASPLHRRLCSGGAIRSKELSHLTLDASGGSIRLFPQLSRWSFRTAVATEIVVVGTGVVRFLRRRRALAPRASSAWGLCKGRLKGRAAPAEGSRCCPMLDAAGGNAHRSAQAR